MKHMNSTYKIILSINNFTTYHFVFNQGYSLFQHCLQIITQTQISVPSVIILNTT